MAEVLAEITIAVAPVRYVWCVTPFGPIEMPAYAGETDADAQARCDGAIADMLAEDEAR